MHPELHKFQHEQCQQCCEAPATKVTQNPEWSQSFQLGGVFIAPYEVCVNCYEEIVADYREQAEEDDANAP